MVLWGAIWGGVFGLLWPGHGWEWQTVVGVLLGALAGRTLRRAIRTEIEAARSNAMATVRLPPVPVPVPVPVPAATTTLRTQAPAGRTAAEAIDDEVSAAAGDFQPTLPLQRTSERVVAAADATASASAALLASASPPAPRPARTPAPPNVVAVLFAKARGWLFGGNTVVRMGVLVLFIGLAFLTKYAMDNALLPPELRLAAIGAAGIALFAAGFWLRRRAAQRGYAVTLQGAGVAVLYLTVFAAFRLYQFLPAGMAFVALGAICAFSAVIALAQHSMAMAFIGFAGGFAAPILVSTGQGNHVALFSYYLVLGIAIAAIAWARAWRPLNLLGFFATFGVATAWGALKYQPAQFASTEPFLVAFFLVYVAASLLYALRHSLAAKKAVDATLVFGVPIVTFGLQAGLVREIEYAMAFSALALGAFYLALGWWLARRNRVASKGGAAQAETRLWLAQCFAALGLGLVTLAVPLALDPRLTSAVWAVEGAAVYWMGNRQGRWLPRAAGLALQLFAALSFADTLGRINSGLWPFANPAFMGASMLAFGALAIAWWSRVAGDAPAISPTWEGAESRLASWFRKLESGLSPWLFWAGFLWLQFAASAEIGRAPLDVQGQPSPVFGFALQTHLQLLAWVGGAFVFHHLALANRTRPWPVAATPAWTVLPALLLAAVNGATGMNHVFEAGGWIIWPVLLLLHCVMLRRLDSGPPQLWWPLVHAGGIWLAVLLVGNLLVFVIGRAQLWQTAWATVILLVAGTLVLLLLSRRAWFEPAHQGWPLDRFARAYLWLAAAPLATGVALSALLVAVSSNGNARPLPYLPLLNPTDLCIAMALAACALWLLRLRGSALALPAIARNTRWPLALLAIGFIAVNTVWLRVAHHFAGVAWDADRMFDSFLVQAGYSILWTLLALALMVGAYRRAARGVWMLGAGLLGATVLKLFVIDLSNRGGSERIFVFIAVGLLMLVVGYFAPIPPAARATGNDALEGVPS